MSMLDKIRDCFSDTVYIDERRYNELHPVQKLGASRIPSLNGIYSIEKSHLDLFKREI